MKRSSSAEPDCTFPEQFVPALRKWKGLLPSTASSNCLSGGFDISDWGWWGKFLGELCLLSCIHSSFSCHAFDWVRMLSWLCKPISNYCVLLALELMISYLWWNVVVEELMTPGGWVLLHTMHQHVFACLLRALCL